MNIDQIPASFAQQRLWFLDQLSPNAGLYNIPIALRLRGALNYVAIQEAFDNLLARHETLRTTIKTSDGQAIQHIVPSATFVLNKIDLSQIHKNEQEQYILDYAQSETDKPFHLSEGPLIRGQLLHINEEEHVLLISIHHIIADGWSMDVLCRELGKFYNAQIGNQELLLPELPIQYADFAIWQREWLKEEVLERQLEYWQKQLSDAPELLKLPTDRPRPKEPSYSGGVYRFKFSKLLLEKIQKVSEQYNTTLFMTLLTIFKIFLYRYTGQSDIVVGSPIANRHYSGVEGLIGFFVNTLALRTNCENNPQVDELLNQVRDMTFDAYEHQDVPFEQLVDFLQINRDLSRHPIFQVWFVLQNAGDSTLNLEGLTAEFIETDNKTLMFDLGLAVQERTDCLALGFEYATDLFDESTIIRMANNFECLVESVVASPGSRLSDLSLLAQEEQQLQLTTWNATASLYPKDKCLHELFEAQVEKTPDLLAVIYNNEQLTYRELNAKANQLAQYLRGLGVGTESLVALCVEPSLELVIGLLGVLKAGGAYVPLAPDYPIERLRFMLEDSQTLVLVTQVGFEKKFPDYQGKFLYLDHDWEKIDHCGKENLDNVTSLQNLAYVIYTSGSTGNPKGVLIPHSAVTNHMQWMQNTYDFNSADTVLQKTSISFDASVWEIYIPLLVGGQLIIAPSDAYKAPKMLVDLILKHQVTTIQLVPLMLREILETNEILSCTSLRHVFVGGDTLSPEIRQLFFKKLRIRLHNLYGPTEATIDTTSFSHEGLNTPLYLNLIGKPISNTQVYILDHYLQLVPIGVAGELCIGGAALACGYLNRPDLTKEKFISNPFSHEPEARLYRTGDLGRYLPNGDIEFLGRIDRQVKLRGYRIELGEIESIIMQDVDVERAIVLLREDVPGQKRLVAYIVAGDYEPSLPELKQFLQQCLPHYMIPSIFIFIDALPLTNSGKVDHKKLPVPSDIQYIAEKDYQAPSTQIEQQLALIWSELLQVERVGINDNFFEIGGDSIIGIQLVSRSRQQGIYFDIRHLFQSPTLAGLAKMAKVQQAVTELPLLQGLATGDLPLTAIQHWFFQQQFENPHYYNQAMLLEVNSILTLDKLELVLQHILRHHDVLRLRFEQSRQGRWTQSYCELEDCIKNFSSISQVLDISLLDINNQEAVIDKTATELQATLNIELGPVFRAVLFNCGKQRLQRLLLVAHHLIIDSVSWRILLEDIETGCRQLIHTEMLQFPDKTHSYQAWARALADYAQSDILVAEKAYWLKLNTVEKFSLPVDYAKGHNSFADLKVVYVTLTPAETTLLLQQVPQAYRTQINDVLLTALVQAMGDWTGQYAVYLSLEGHGREKIIEGIDISRTVGWFTSIFPVYLALGESKETGAALKTVKEQLRAIPARGIGYGILKYLSQDNELKQPDKLPEPSLSFNYLGQWDGNANREGMFHFATESSGVNICLKNHRPYQLDVNAQVINGSLRISWDYSSYQYQTKTIQQLSDNFIGRLRELIRYCCNKQTFGYTPSDFPLAALDQSTLDKTFGHHRDIEDIYPLSSMQAGLLFRALYQSDSDAYFLQSVYELTDEVDQDLLFKAWQGVMNKHSILRTAFVWEGIDQPLQYVLRSIPLAWEFHDWQALSDAEQTHELKTLLQSDRCKSFNLSIAPLFRLQLIQLSANRYYLMWTFLHIIVDGWSTPIILQDLLIGYKQLQQGKPLQLGYIRPYRDYINWLQQQDMGDAEVFWRKYLSGFNEPTKLNLKGSKADTMVDGDSTYEHYRLVLSRVETEQLQTLAKQQQLTLNTVIQGAWSVLLNRYSQEDDIVFGVTISGRAIDLLDVEHMVGLFINTLPLRLRISANDDIFSILKKLQQEMTQIQQYGYVPLAKIQSWSEIYAGKSLFDSIIVFGNYPAGEDESADGLRMKGISGGAEKTEYPLTIGVLPSEELSFYFGYEKEHFDNETIRRLAVHLRNVLQAFCEDAYNELSN